MKQQADKEMTSIRRILDILGGLTPSQQTRTMAFVNGRLADAPINPPAVISPLKNVKLELPFPDQEETKRNINALADGGAGSNGAALISTSIVDVKQ